MSTTTTSVIEPVRGGASVPANTVAELEFTVDRDFADPWEELSIHLVVTDPLGVTRTIPAFWAGGRSWKARYSSPIAGPHTYRVASDAECGVAGISGEIQVVTYVGTNALLMHGGPRVADDGRHLAHADGTPFLWLADTWWAGMTGRFEWPTTFQTLADDRAAKGFNVVQIVAGLVPEFVPFSPEMASEGGQPWTDVGQGQINPDFFSVPDLKIDYLVQKGIAPCIVGGWGFFVQILGRERILSHWRYLVARYGAYPVVWCLGGEANASGLWESLSRSREVAHPSIVAGDLSRDEVLDRIDPLHLDLALFGETDAATTARKNEANELQCSIWEDASAYVGEIDAFHRIRTVHPAPTGEEGGSSAVFGSRDSFDLDMMQTGHTGIACMPATHRYLQKSLSYGDKPVINGECSYEGIFDSSWNDVQTFIFWSHMLSGAAGHTYGTMAISTFSSRTDEIVPLSKVSVHNWQDAIEWRGAIYVGVGKRILERFPWWLLEPAQEYLDLAAGPDNWLLPFAAKLPDGTVLAYRPNATTIDLGLMTKATPLSAWSVNLAIKDLPADSYAVTFVNPRNGGTHPVTESVDTREGPQLIRTPTMEDWIVVLRPH